MFSIRRHDPATPADQAEEDTPLLTERAPAGYDTADQQVVNSNPSVIAAGAFLRGNISTPGPLHLQGTVDGEVQAPHIALGVQGSVRGTLTSGQLVIEGRVEGELRCKDVHAGDTARIIGIVRCTNLSLKAGAVINAEVEIGSDPTARN